MAETIQYICTEGDRWDLISWKAYGTIDNTADIIAANPNVLITERLAAGTVLDIPIVDSSNVLTDTEKLPPWKQ
jgi:phage tail protein X